MCILRENLTGINNVMTLIKIQLSQVIMTLIYVTSIRYSLEPINFSQLTIKVYLSVVTVLAYNNTEYSVSQDVITEFDCNYWCSLEGMASSRVSIVTTLQLYGSVCLNNKLSLSTFLFDISFYR